MPIFQRKLRLFLPICVLCVSATCILHAQQSDGNESQNGGPPANGARPPGSPPTAAQELQRITKELSLSEEQQTEVLPILTKRHTEIDALMQSNTDRAAMGPQMRAIMDATNKQIRALLTEAQQKLFDNMRPPRPPGQNENGPGSGGPPPPDGGSALQN